MLGCFLSSPLVYASESTTPFFKAIEKNDVVTAEQLLKHGARSDTSLPRQFGNSEIFTNNYPPETAFLYAVALDRSDIVTAMIKYGADVNYCAVDCRRPLHFAVFYNKPKMARLLLELKADPNGATNYQELTPLFFAVSAGSEEIVKILLEHGADPKQPTRSGAMPIDDADSDNIKMLLRQYGERKK